MDLKKLKSAFASQKCAARKRGIFFNMSFDEWLGWWVETGKLPLRGKAKGCYQMCRFGDVGAYELGNIYCDTIERNSRLPHEGKPRPISATQKSIETKRRNGTVWFADHVRERARENARVKVFALIKWAIENQETLSVAVRKFHSSWNAMRTHKHEWEAIHGAVPLPKKASGDKNWKRAGLRKVSSPFGNFSSAKEAAKKLNMPQSSIAYRCQHNLKGWSYA